MKNDEKIYEIVAKELRSGLIRDGLWLKALSRSLGDKEIAKSLYIEWRVNQLLEEWHIIQKNGLRLKKLKANAEKARKEAEKARVRAEEAAQREKEFIHTHSATKYMRRAYKYDIKNMSDDAKEAEELARAAEEKAIEAERKSNQLKTN